MVDSTTNPVTLFSTVREFCYSLVHKHGGVQQEQAITLDDKIRSLTVHKERIKITGQRIDNFCAIVGEINPFHTNAEFAKGQKHEDGTYEDRFAPGTMLAALGEQFSEGLIKSINEVVAPRQYCPKSFDIHFGTHPVYPNTNLLWVFYDFAWDENNGDLNIRLVGGDAKRLRKADWSELDKREIKRIGCTIDIRLSQDGVFERTFYNRDFARTQTLTRDGLGTFMVAIEDNPPELQEVPFMYSAAFITSSLLDLSKEFVGKISGIHIGTNFEFYRKPEVGKEQIVEFFFRGKDKDHFGKQTKSRYRIDAVVSQAHRPLYYGEVNVLS